MTVMLGTISLSEDLVLPDFKNIPKRSIAVRYTRGGRVFLTSTPIVNGQVIELVDDSDLGAFTGSQVDSINQHKETGEPVEFIHHLGAWLVVVESTEFVQPQGYANPGESEMYSGSIFLRILADL